jgi:hypothetical protein
VVLTAVQVVVLAAIEMLPLGKQQAVAARLKAQSI